jgi:hypothetical protein
LLIKNSLGNLALRECGKFTGMRGSIGSASFFDFFVARFEDMIFLSSTPSSFLLEPTGGFPDLVLAETKSSESLPSDSTLTIGSTF